MKFRISGGVLLCALALVLTSCGDSGPSKAEVREAEHSGAERAQQHNKIHQIQKELMELRNEKGPGAKTSSQPTPDTPGPGPEVASGNCEGGLSANQYTTCGFAEAVELAYFEELGSGSGTVQAFSPTTETTYSMHCTAGEPHECTGGNNAAVFFP